MILPCAYGMFGKVGAKNVQGTSVLDASFLRGDKSFDILGCFIGEFV